MTLLLLMSVSDASVLLMYDLSVLAHFRVRVTPRLVHEKGPQMCQCVV